MQHRGWSNICMEDEEHNQTIVELSKRPFLKTKPSYQNIPSIGNLHKLTRLTTIVFLLTNLIYQSNAIPLVKFNRWISDDLMRRSYNDLSRFPYPLIDPFHSYFALPLHRNNNLLQQKLKNVEPLQRSILSNNEVIKAPLNDADYDIREEFPDDALEDEKQEDISEEELSRSMSRINAHMAFDPRHKTIKKLINSKSSQNIDELESDGEEPFVEDPSLNVKYEESSKRSPTASESEQVLSLVKMFMKLKAEGFDIRPTRKDKGIIDTSKMTAINPDHVMVCKSAPYNICYKVDQKAGKLIPISRNIKPVRILRVY